MVFFLKSHIPKLHIDLRFSIYFAQVEF